jgi:exopolyphosphatase / guanosine-5'-triphosphate,3'-diphosphate pyrophosphatase
MVASIENAQNRFNVGRRRAVVDVGSNSVLLVIAELQNANETEREDWVSIYEESHVTGLGEGTKSTGIIGERGLNRTLDVLRAYGEKTREYGVTESLAAATMAVRIASNQQEAVEKMHEVFPNIRVLSGEEEAELGFLSVVDDPAFSDHQRISIVDPGGHSTEIVTAEQNESGWNVLYRKSYPVGSLSIRSQWLNSESNNGLAVLRATSKIDEIIGLCYRQNQCGTVIALGAAGTNLLSIRDQLLDWDPGKVHGKVLTYEEISKFVGTLMPMSDSERKAIPGLEKGRESTIQHGALILERFLFALRAEECYLSVRGWRHALLKRLDQYI